MDVRTLFPSIVIGSVVTLLVGFAITLAAPGMRMQEIVCISAGVGTLAVLAIVRWRRR